MGDEGSGKKKIKTSVVVVDVVVVIAAATFLYHPVCFCRYTTVIAQTQPD